MEIESQSLCRRQGGSSSRKSPIGSIPQADWGTCRVFPSVEANTVDHGEATGFGTHSGDRSVMFQFHRVEAGSAADRWAQPPRRSSYSLRNLVGMAVYSCPAASQPREAITARYEYVTANYAYDCVPHSSWPRPRNWAHRSTGSWPRQKNAQAQILCSAPSPHSALVLISRPWTPPRSVVLH